MGKVILVGVVCFLIGALAESAIRDFKLVAEYSKTIHEYRCELAAIKGVKQDDCN